jgi:hypothetical protein
MCVFVSAERVWGNCFTQGDRQFGSEGTSFGVRLSQIPEYRDIAFFHHLLLKKS